MNGFVTAPEAAQKLRVHINTLRRYISEGKIKAFKLAPGSRWRIRTEDLEDFIRRMK